MFKSNCLAVGCSTGLAILVLSACATQAPMVYKAEAGPRQEIIYSQGAEVLVSQQRNIVMLSKKPLPQGSSGEAFPTFVIQVRNGGGDHFNFTADDVQVKKGDQALKLMTSEELAAAGKSGGFARTMASVVAITASAAALTAARGGNVAATQSSLAQQQSQLASMQVASMQVASMQARDQADSEAFLAHYTTGLLKNQTLFPGDTIGGVLAFSQPEEQGGRYDFTVKVGGEIHELHFNQQTAQ